MKNVNLKSVQESICGQKSNATAYIYEQESHSYFTREVRSVSVSNATSQKNVRLIGNNTVPSTIN